jgi:response regulator RpfG family c-di-GMP phosphodiesterase
MLYQTAQFVKEMASAITYTPAPSPEWKRAVNDFYILDKGLNVNRYLTDVWREYDITSYVAEAKLDSVLYLQNANTYLDIVNTLDDEIEVVISDLEDLYDTLDIAGSPQELINNIVLNIEALNDAETEISALKKEVENFIFLVQN